MISKGNGWIFLRWIFIVCDFHMFRTVRILYFEMDAIQIFDGLHILVWIRSNVFRPEYKYPITIGFIVCILNFLLRSNFTFKKLKYYLGIFILRIYFYTLSEAALYSDYKYLSAINIKYFLCHIVSYDTWINTDYIP